MKQAENNGYLKQDGRKSLYKITDKGIDEIKKYKVDGALILACGMGIRLAPLTYDTPKCFIKIKGERMIERQIEQLKSAGINDISIMVGFLKEKFDYLIDKYNVKLVYNEEYKYKNTLSTFYHAKEILRNKNMYVCVSDVYITENIYHEYECEPYYTGAFYDDCKGEWRYITNNKNEFQGVELGGKNDYCLVGPCFMTKEFLNSFIPMIEDYYDRTSTENFYWEDVLVNNLEKLPTMYVYKHNKGLIFEFDTLKDLKQYDKENEEYGSEAISFVSKALGIKEKDIENIECIKEGMTNHSYKFTYGDETFFVRVPGEYTNTYIDRKAEAKVLYALSDKGIGEEVVYFDENTGYKISKFISGARLVDINSVEDLKKCMALYAKFHTFGIKVDASCDIIDKIEEYLKIIRDRDIVVPYEDFDLILEEAKKVKAIIEKENRPKTLCHGDPNPNNVLITNGGIKMIDFEYAGMADPISDIALFGDYVKFDVDKTFDLYKMYKESFDKANEIIPEDDKLAKRLITSYMALGGLYNALWVVVRNALSGADYGVFGMAGYRMFKNCYSKL